MLFHNLLLLCFHIKVRPIHTCEHANFDKTLAPFSHVLYGYYHVQIKIPVLQSCIIHKFFYRLRVTNFKGSSM